MILEASRCVILVCGPPCAGKSTLVERWRRAGDLVVDFDAIASSLGSPGKWAHSRAVGDAAEREVQARFDEVGVLDSGRAWLVRCVPDAGERLALARRVRADRVVVLLPVLGVLLDRAAGRPAPAETRRAIMRWRDAYAPAGCDELVRNPDLFEGNS